MTRGSTQIDLATDARVLVQRSLGNNAVTEAQYRANPNQYAGFVRHYIAPVNNDLGYPLESQALGATREYGAPGVHAPN